MQATQPHTKTLIAESRSRAAQPPALPALTGLRFVAAAWVVMFHSRLWQLLAERGFRHAGAVVRHGSLAVTLFFLLSGFVLSYNYRSRLTPLPAKRQFWEARLARIWPVYLFSLLVMAFVSHGAAVPHNLWLALGTVFMVQGWVPGHSDLAGAWNMVGWTLSVEIFFYLLMPFLQTWVDRCSRRTLWLLLAAAVGIAVAADVSSKTMEDLHYTGLLNLLPLPVVKLPEFFAGGLLANLLLVTTDAAWLRNHRGGVFTWVGLLLALVVLGSNGLRVSWVVAPFLLLITGLAVEVTALSRLLGSRLLLFLGAISYSMYLLQIAVKEGTRPLIAHLASIVTPWVCSWYRFCWCW